MVELLIEAALKYAAKGWPIFAVQHDKTPFPGTNGVLDATTNPDTIKEMWRQHPGANIGLDAGGAGMMVLDYDPGFNIEELEKNVGPIPDTALSSSTPRGGQHDFYSLSPGELVPPSASRLAKHVDVRSFHSYVLLPPSQTVDGEYNWTGTGKPAHRTDQILRVASSTGGRKHERRDEWLIDPDLNENIRLAEDWLRTTAKVAIEGQGGDHCTYATAAMLLGYGISEERALALMLEHWNSRCDPPWPPEDLATKISNAYEYHENPPGRLTPAYHKARTASLFKPVHTDIPEGDETRVAGFRFADRPAMRHVKAPEWTITDLIAEDSYTMIFGAWGTFKTFLALDMALSIASDLEPGPQALWQAPTQGPVLFAAGEARTGIIKRVMGWEQVHNEGEPVNDFILVDPVPLVAISEEHLAAFVTEALRRRPGGYKMLVIDTVSKAMAGENENEQKMASQFTLLTQRLQAELGGSVLALHHSGYSDDKRSRGSSVFPADTDTVVRLDRVNKTMITSLTMTKQKDAPEWDSPKYAKLQEVVLTDNGGATLVAVKPDESELPKDATTDPWMQEMDRAITRILRDSGRRWKWTEFVVALSQELKYGQNLVSGRLKTLIATEGTVATRCYQAAVSPGIGKWVWVAD